MTNKYTVALVVVSVLFGVAAAFLPHPTPNFANSYLTFKSWMRQHGKQYDSFEESMTRFDIFKQNLEFIEKHNSENHGFQVALNKYADLTNDEFRSLMNGLKVSKIPEVNAEDFSVPVDSLPSSVNWVTKGAVTPVKNQGQCGCCWSFSATGSMEGAYAIATGNLVSLSEQNLVDCSSSYGNQGCNGGVMDYAFEYVIANKGIDTESSYPYLGYQENTCKFNRNNVGATISSYTDVTSGSEPALQTAVANVGPVSIGIDASGSAFQFYSGGVYYNPDCSSTNLDHGVLAVGYGVDSSSGADYWLVKNSWGTDWGINGYIMMARNRNNNCGVATMASYPVVDSVSLPFDEELGTTQDVVASSGPSGVNSGPSSASGPSSSGPSSSYSSSQESSSSSSYSSSQESSYSSSYSSSQESSYSSSYSSSQESSYSSSYSSSQESSYSSSYSSSQESSYSSSYSSSQESSYSSSQESSSSYSSSQESSSSYSSSQESSTGASSGVTTSN
jgi:cathepsin L